MAHSSPLTEGQILAGKYRVERSLGSGGMGVVVAARHLQLGTGVAIKLLRPEACADATQVARFVREARAAARLQSEHVARVVDVGTLDTGAPYMVMELLSGSDLAHVLAAEGPLPVERAAEHVLEACEALAEAHALGIVHRDLKPANLFLARRADGSPYVKVLDFGISKVLPTAEGAAASGAVTATGAVFGTPFYMSPEQIRSARSVDARTDVWSLGAVLYELLTGKKPFTAEALPAVFLAIATEAPVPPRELRRDLPPALEALLLACLEKDPARRVPGVGELARRLAPFAPPSAAALVERVQRLSRSGHALQAPPPSGPADAAVQVQAATGKSWEGSTPAATKSRAPLVVGIALGVAALAVGSAVVIPRLRSVRAQTSALPAPTPSAASSPPDPVATLPPPRDEPSASTAVASAGASGAPSAKPTPSRRLPGARPPKGKHDESSPTVE